MVFVFSDSHFLLLPALALVPKPPRTSTILGLTAPICCRKRRARFSSRSPLEALSACVCWARSAAVKGVHHPLPFNNVEAPDVTPTKLAACCGGWLVAACVATFVAAFEAALVARSDGLWQPQTMKRPEFSGIHLPPAPAPPQGLHATKCAHTQPPHLLHCS